MNAVFVIYKAKTRLGNNVDPQSCEVNYDKPISSIDDIKNIECMISKEIGYSVVKVLNWKRFE